MKTEFKDFLGNLIEEGMRAIRVHSSGHRKSFKRVSIVKVDYSRKYDPIGIVTDGNNKIGWTYPERIIVETAFKEKI